MRTRREVPADRNSRKGRRKNSGMRFWDSTVPVSVEERFGQETLHDETQG